MQKENNDLEKILIDNQTKYVMMANGLYLVKPECKIDWLAFVDINAEQNLALVDTIRYCLMELESAVPYLNILKACLSVTTEKNVKKVIAPVVAYFNYKGEKFQEFVEENLNSRDTSANEIDASLTYVLNRKKKYLENN